MNLRPYQSGCIDNVYNELKTKKSTLYVMATGLGKTVVIAHLTKQAEKRVLILAHRNELIHQAARTVEIVTGEKPAIEMADSFSDEKSAFWDSKSKCVVGSIQTQCARGGRMKRFDPREFSLVILDEAHRSTAASYRKVIKHYSQNPECKIIGCTATPDRSDEESLGQVFESCAFTFEITDAIREGWLVPVTQKQVFVESLDFSNVRTTAGDLNGGDLAAIMEFEENLHKVADPMIQICGERQTLAFATSVVHAERIAEILNRQRPGCARSVCGETPKEERAAMFKDYAEKKFQFLVNCMVATEGFDCPGIEVVALARPTKSRALFAQMIGRGTRPLPGIVDGPETPELRRIAIRDSAKPSVEILDFVGVSGKHQLVSAVDVLAGNYTPEVVEAVKKAEKERAKKPNEQARSIEESLAEMKKKLEIERLQREEAARRKSLVGKTVFTVTTNSAFGVLGIQPKKLDGFRPLANSEKEQLLKAGVEIAAMTESEQRQVLEEITRRRIANLCTFRQTKILKKHGIDATKMTFEQARQTIDAIAAAGWPKKWTVAPAPVPIHSDPYSFSDGSPVPNDFAYEAPVDIAEEMRRTVYGT